MKATGFLGGAPWIWDQAEPIQGRADERNERIDAVTRGLLGLTVACARCHDHKYDPILAKDYYALGGIFASSTYKEYNFVPDEEVTFWREKLTKANDKDKATQDYVKQAGLQLAEAYAAQTSEYMVGAWRVSGKPKMKVAEAARSGQARPRDARSLGRVPRQEAALLSIPPRTGRRWSPRAGRKTRRSSSGRFVPAAHPRSRARKRGDRKENDKIKAKAGVITDHREKDAKPSDFDTYDEFCPGCTLELKVMSTEKANFYEDLFIRQLGTGVFDERGMPGLFVVSRMGPGSTAWTRRAGISFRAAERDGSNFKKIGEQYPLRAWRGGQAAGDQHRAGSAWQSARTRRHRTSRFVRLCLGLRDKKPYTRGQREA